MAGMMFTSSCEDQLKIDPTASLAPELVGPSDASKLLTGIYDALQEGGTNYIYLSYVTEDLSADNLVYRATFFQHGEVDNNAILTDNVLVSRYFSGPYVAIQRANDLIEILNTNASIAESVKKPMLGQAHFLRAYAYYKLVTLFGGVPIVDNRDVVKVKRNTEEEVYNKIIEDLKLSIDNAPSFTNNFFASAEAAKGLLARVYLIRKNFPLAKQYANEVITSNKFTVATDYNSIWAPPYKSSEHIFTLNFTTTEGSNSLSYFLQHASMPGGGRAELPVDQSLIDAYEPGDKRKEASVVQVATAPAGWYSYKHRDPNGTGGHPLYVLRISEMYLIAAEAQYLISNSATDAEALASINYIRTRRGLGELATLDLQKVIHERRVELAFEGTRWTDMKRTPSPTNPQKSLATVFLESKGRTANDALYPIPQSAINTNELLLPNNPGYN